MIDEKNKEVIKIVPNLYFYVKDVDDVVRKEKVA